MLTRYVIPDVSHFAVGPLSELAPDLTVVSTDVDADGAAKEVQGILIVDAATGTGVIAVLTDEVKDNLVRALTGVVLAKSMPADLPSLPGHLSRV